MRQSRSNRSSRLRAISVIVSIIVNVSLAFVTYKSGLPIYLDTVGTVAIAATAGLFPGIITAVITNVLCSTFNPAAIYFGIVNVLIAMYTSWFARQKGFGRLKDNLIYILVAGSASGAISALIQWRLFDGPQNTSVKAFMESFEGLSVVYQVVLFVLLTAVLSIFDKGISLMFTKLVQELVPKKTQTAIRNSGWRQKPLSIDELGRMDTLSTSSRLSLKSRITVMFIVVVLVLTAVMGWTGIKLYFANAKQEKTEIATSAASFASQVVDTAMLDDYLRYGIEAEGYAQTESMLYRIMDNAAGVNELYVVKINSETCQVVFDCSYEEAHTAGDIYKLDEAFDPYTSALASGQRIEPIENKSFKAWNLTVLEPIFDSSGKCVAYAGADVSLAYMADYMADFLVKVFLILSSFVVLVIAYALWVAGIYMVYPINSIVASVDRFVHAGNDQTKLDEAVKGIRDIDIYTGDEVEELYHAVSEMALSQTEQMRSLRRFSDNTVRMQDGLIITMADLVENRDSDTGAHIQKTAAYVKIIVEGLLRKGYYAEKITPKFMSDCVRSAPLHDIGKINIPDSVLNKPGKLTDEEYAIIKTHAVFGRKIIEKAINTVEGENYLKEARNMAGYHHERWDGKGYPEGLHGEAIPLSARIMSVADVFDALASPRVYKPAFPLSKALAIIEEGSGTQFDPKCVEVFLDSLPEVKQVLRKYNQLNEESDAT
ncbi:MAG: HD domain-containing protein [Saccharofermentans sp.]|nr:HD domain-containing protein [Saccharofermentans sp.]